MNLLDAWVTEVLGEPYEKYGKWWVSVNAICEGTGIDTQIMCSTKEEADKVSVGYKFQT